MVAAASGGDRGLQPDYSKDFYPEFDSRRAAGGSQDRRLLGFHVFIRIVLPLSKAIVAVLVLFYGVGHWNAYFNAMIYLHDKALYPLTLFLREILMADQIDPSTVTDPELQAQLAQAAGVIKYALIVVSMVPVLVIYPFIQKYFVKGVMIGSVKG